MPSLAIIIPYYQREAEVLVRAVSSICQQRLPDGWEAEIIIVDDGSPLPAVEALAGKTFVAPFRLRVISQPNMGAAAARTRGLDEVSPSCSLIAFLDSDDEWPEKHLAGAITAHEQGYDFVFADNVRAGYHESYIHNCSPKTAALISLHKRSDEHDIIALPTDVVPGLIIEEFPTQISTVTYSRNIAPHLRFDSDLQTAGEDVLFLVKLVLAAKKIGFRASSLVRCGDGVNIFFKNFHWNSESFLKIKANQLQLHAALATLPGLPEAARRDNGRRLKRLRMDFIFHTARRIAKHRRVPRETLEVAKHDKRFLLWLPVHTLMLVLQLATGAYRP